MYYLILDYFSVRLHSNTWLFDDGEIFEFDDCIVVNHGGSRTNVSVNVLYIISSETETIH